MRALLSSADSRAGRKRGVCLFAATRYATALRYVLRTRPFPIGDRQRRRSARGAATTWLGAFTGRRSDADYGCNNDAESGALTRGVMRAPEVRHAPGRQRFYGFFV